MLKINFLWFFVPSLLNFLFAQKVKASIENNCIIFNSYHKEFLYAADKLFSKHSSRSVYTWEVSFWYKWKNSVKLVYTDEDTKGLWYFEPVERQKDTYFIRNYKYNEYLQANSGQDSHRKFISTEKLIRNLDKSFMWRFKKVSNDVYTIWNVKYDEPLFAVSDKENGFSLRRSVFTEPHIENKDLHKYWVLKCRNGVNPV